MKSCIYLIFITHHIFSVCLQMILLGKSRSSWLLKPRAVQEVSGLVAVWTTRKWRCRSWNQTSAWHTHTLNSHSDNPHSTTSQYRHGSSSEAYQVLAASIQNARLRTRGTDKTWNWSIAGIQNLFNSGTPKKYYTLFFLSTLDFDLSNCNRCSRNFSKIVFYRL